MVLSIILPSLFFAKYYTTVSSCAFAFVLRIFISRVGLRFYGLLLVAHNHIF